jgi:hypothetical protein
MELYAALPDRASEMRDAGVDIRGTVDDLLREAEVGPSSWSAAAVPPGGRGCMPSFSRAYCR